MRIRKSEPVQLVAKTHGYFPASFRWRGRRFDVVAVEKCWTVSGPAVRRRLPCAARPDVSCCSSRSRAITGRSLAGR